MRYCVEIELYPEGSIEHHFVDAPDPDEALFRLEQKLNKLRGKNGYYFNKIFPDDFGDFSLI